MGREQFLVGFGVVQQVFHHLHQFVGLVCRDTVETLSLIHICPDTSCQTDKTILPCRWFARFHATGYVLFLLGLPVFTDFSFEVF